MSSLVDSLNNLISKGTSDPHKGRAEEYGKRIGEILHDTLKDWCEPPKPSKKLRMSNVGKPCKRQLWYGIHRPKTADVDPELRLRFLYGHLLEEVLLYLLEEAGHEITGQQKEITYKGIKGHIDAIVDGDTVLDVKTASNYGIKKFQEGLTDDPFGYKTQIGGYRMALGLPKSKFLVIDKSNGALCECETTGDDVAVELDVDNTLFDMSEEVPPSRKYAPVPHGKSGNMTLSKECNFCNYKLECFPKVRVFKYSNGLVYLTTVVRTPDVLEFTGELR